MKYLMKRYALIHAPVDAVTPYLPRNYTTIDTPDGETVIEGRDTAGWTLDAYVLPRLASGLIFGEEIDLRKCREFVSGISSTRTR